MVRWLFGSPTLIAISNTAGEEAWIVRRKWDIGGGGGG